MQDMIYPLIEYVVNFRDEDIPAQVTNKTAALFKDTIGCILAGSTAEGITRLIDTVRYFGGNSQTTVIGFAERTSAPFAALLNSTMGHARDFDDTHDKALNHGCVTIVPALLAVAELLSRRENPCPPGINSVYPVTGRQFIAALAIGLDIANRLGMAFIPYLHTGWLPTTLWGPFGGVAACGRLLKLDETRMYNAFGMAYSQINGNRQSLLDGTLAKRIQPGFSASGTIQAVLMGANNISGARNIINGRFGIPALYTAGKIDNRYLTEKLGLSFETLNISIKPYPSCRCTHPIIDAALSLRQKHHMKWQDIKAGCIYLPPNSIGQIGNPFRIRENPTVDAQFSAQYTAALAFIKGRPKLGDFERESVISNKEVISLASIFEVIEFEKHSSSPVPVELKIKLKDNQNIGLRIEDPKGSQTNPLSQEDLTFKFNDCVDNSVKKYSPDQRKKIIAGLDNILNCQNMEQIISLF